MRLAQGEQLLSFKVLECGNVTLGLEDRHANLQEPCRSIWRPEKEKGAIQQGGTHGNVKGETQNYRHPHPSDTEIRINLKNYVL